MVSWLQIIAASIITLILLGLIQYIIRPYIRLQMRRRQALLHLPEAEEIWVQDDGILYIDEVNASGVEIITFDPKTKTPYRWKDSWEEWNKRLRMRTVYFTGERRPLGPL